MIIDCRIFLLTLLITIFYKYISQKKSNNILIKKIK